MRALLLAALLSACAGKTADTAPPAAPAIAWQAWSADAFAQAQREDRMIIVDVGIEGCTACRWMEQKTYGNADVAALIDEHFVAISVDAEARPDIGERYEYWAWPATIFMSPDGEQVLAIRGNKLPKNFLPILQQLIEAKRAGTLTGDNKQPITAPPRVLDGPLEELRKNVVARMDKSFDAKLGGWGTMKSPAKAHLRHAFLRAHARGETAWRDHGLRTLEGMTGLIDPEWGGVFVASFEGWNKPVPEKRIAGQAAALHGFATAYRVSGDARWKAHAAAVTRYVESTLQADDGTFYTSQEDVAPKLPASLTAADYYALADGGGFAVFVKQTDQDALDGATVDFVERVNESGFEVRPMKKEIGAKEPPTGPIAERVRAVLDTQVNPAIAAHGGMISLVDVEETDVYVEMSGGCQGCALSRMTLRQGVERMLREAVPELTAVHDVTDHASGDNPYL